MHARTHATSPPPRARHLGTPFSLVSRSHGVPLVVVVVVVVLGLFARPFFVLYVVGGTPADGQGRRRHPHHRSSTAPRFHTRTRPERRTHFIRPARTRVERSRSVVPVVDHVVVVLRRRRHRRLRRPHAPNTVVVALSRAACRRALGPLPKRRNRRGPTVRRGFMNRR